MHKDLATQIYDALNAEGAGLGNYSIRIIQRTLDRAVFCIHCWGTGQVEDSLHSACPDCDGTGTPMGSEESV